MKKEGDPREPREKTQFHSMNACSVGGHAPITFVYDSNGFWKLNRPFVDKEELRMTLGLSRGFDCTGNKSRDSERGV